MSGFFVKGQSGLTFQMFISVYFKSGHGSSQTASFPPAATTCQTSPRHWRDNSHLWEVAFHTNLIKFLQKNANLIQTSCSKIDSLSSLLVKSQIVEIVECKESLPSFCTSEGNRASFILQSSWRWVRELSKVHTSIQKTHRLSHACFRAKSRCMLWTDATKKPVLLAYLKPHS